MVVVVGVDSPGCFVASVEGVVVFLCVLGWLLTSVVSLDVILGGEVSIDVDISRKVLENQSDQVPGLWCLLFGGMVSPKYWT